MKFLSFEQTLKNSLSTFPMGGAVGGSDFDPDQKCDREIYSFCKSYMTELCKHMEKVRGWWWWWLCWLCWWWVAP